VEILLRFGDHPNIVKLRDVSIKCFTLHYYTVLSLVYFQIQIDYFD